MTCAAAAQTAATHQPRCASARLVFVRQRHPLGAALGGLLRHGGRRSRGARAADSLSSDKAALRSPSRGCSTVTSSREGVLPVFSAPVMEPSGSRSAYSPDVEPLPAACDTQHTALSPPAQPSQLPSRPCGGGGNCGQGKETVPLQQTQAGHDRALYSSGSEDAGSEDEETPLRLGRLLYQRGLLSKAGELTLRARLASRSERSSEHSLSGRLSPARDEDFLQDGCANPGCGEAQQLPGACGCGEVTYCSVECAADHWREHRKSCLFALRISLSQGDLEKPG